MDENFDERGKLQEHVIVRLKHGEVGVILLLVSAADDVYLVEIFEDGDTSGVPLDMGCFVHISEMKALIKEVNGEVIEIPLQTYGKSEPPFRYEDKIDITRY